MKFADIENTIGTRTNYRPTIAWRRDLQDKLNSWAEMGLELDPDFQRGHVWSKNQQIAYIEYILRGGVSGRELYFNCATWGGKYNTPIYLVDGKQRLTAVLAFLNNEIPAFGYLLSEFEDGLPNEPCFYFNMNNLCTRKEMMEWYVGLNGGVAHTSEEIDRVKTLIAQEGN